MSAVLDRTTPPALQEIAKPNLLKANSYKTGNGVPVHYINAGSQEVLRIEFQFQAGIISQNQALVASTTNALLKEGSAKYSAKQIAELIDYYGAFYENDCGRDNASIALFCLTKHLDKLLPVIHSVITEATFPEKEFDIYRTNSKQQLSINNKKVNHVARNRFTEVIYGPTHPYGVYATENDYDKLNVSLLKNFYAGKYLPGNMRIMLSGMVSDDSLKLIDSYFGQTPAANQTVANAPAFEEIKPQRHVFEMENSMQSAIRIGKRLFNKLHPDYMGFQVLNTLLGGYFGSRLMSNIREDKGYTYGIGSSLASLLHDGYFFVSTEVGVDVTKNAVNEIFFEIDRLLHEPVSQEELELVKNYMLGSFIRSVDGPFALADKFNAIYDYGLGYDFYDKYMETIHHITPKDIMELAQKHLQRDSFTEIIAGKTN